MIMAKSKVTGMYILLLMFQQHCYYYYTIQIFIVMEPLQAIGDSYGIFPVSSAIIILCRARKKNFFFRTALWFPLKEREKKKKPSSIFVFSSHYLQFAMVNLARLPSVFIPVVTIYQSGTVKRGKYLFLFFWCLFKKLKSKNSLKP